MAQTLSVTDNVCKQIKVDFPNIKNVFGKSDNAGCYSGNGCLERACHILRQNDFSLIKHDLNEPQKGKDQCDRESAVAQHCRTVYINARHNIQAVENMKNRILYMNGVKNAKIYIVEIDSSVNEIESQKIDNISNYYSAELEDNKICFWNYYSIGKGMVVEKKCVEFSCGLKVLSKFEKVGSSYNSTPCKNKKTRLDRMRNNNILYCPISDCVKIFPSEAALENHMLLNKYIESLTGLDQVK